MYYACDNVPENNAAAAHLCRLAADHGIADAHSDLCGVNPSGEGVPEDSVATFMRSNIACAQALTLRQQRFGVQDMLLIEQLEYGTR
jgi:TPR repeat protein